VPYVAKVTNMPFNRMNGLRVARDRSLIAGSLVSRLTAHSSKLIAQSS